MKKVGKLIAALIAVGGIAVGAYALYRKYFSPEHPDDDFDEDYDDEFEEDLDKSPSCGRGYVSLTPTEITEADDPAPAEEEPAEPADLPLAEEDTAEANAHSYDADFEDEPEETDAWPDEDKKSEE